jgi:hypothetical protein
MTKWDVAYLGRQKVPSSLLSKVTWQNIPNYRLIMSQSLIEVLVPERAMG